MKEAFRIMNKEKNGGFGELTQETLDKEMLRLKATSYPQKRKWMEFAECLLKQGYTLKLKEAVSTVSRYILVFKPGVKQYFKVRFSNHKPNKHREMGRVFNDCDFFVGVTHKGYTTTTDALLAVDNFFKGAK